MSTHAAWLLWARGDALTPRRTWLTGWLSDTLDPLSSAGPLDGLERVPPGWTLRWRLGQPPRLQRPPPACAHPSLTWRSVDEAADALRSRLLSVVDAPVNDTAVLLSGGMDASSVLATWAQHHPGTSLNAASMVSRRWPSFDERDALAHLEARLKPNLQRWFVEDHWPMQLASWVFEDPWRGPHPHPSKGVLRRFFTDVQHAHGVTWLMTGEGGDHLFSIPPQGIREAWLQSRPDRLLRHPAGRAQLTQWLRQTLTAELKQRLPPAWVTMLQYTRSRRASAMPWSWHRWASHDLLHAVLRHERQHVEPTRYNMHDWFWERMLATQRSLQQQVGVALWMPFCDERIHRLAEQLPTAWLVHTGFQKAVLRHAMRPWLPHAIVTRRKSGTFDALFASLLAHPQTLALSETLLDDESRLQALGLIEARLLQKAITAYAARVESRTRTDLAGLVWLWHFLLAECWLRALDTYRLPSLAEACRRIFPAPP